MSAFATSSRGKGKTEGVLEPAPAPRNNSSSDSGITVVKISVGRFVWCPGLQRRGTQAPIFVDLGRDIFEPPRREKTKVYVTIRDPGIRNRADLGFLMAQGRGGKRRDQDSRRR
jgi:hypothetical protein